jgi:bifunctional non-homologous end joining protein LigD
VGKVGSGFNQADGEAILARMRRVERKTSPFDAELGRTVVGDEPHWVRPTLVGEVAFTEWTPDGRLRHPVWRGLRTDKEAGGVAREP